MKENKKEIRKKIAYLQHLAIFSKITYVAIPRLEFPPKIAVTKLHSDVCLSSVP